MYTARNTYHKLCSKKAKRRKQKKEEPYDGSDQKVNAHIQEASLAQASHKTYSTHTYMQLLYSSHWNKQNTRDASGTHQQQLTCLLIAWQFTHTNGHVIISTDDLYTRGRQRTSLSLYGYYDLQLFYNGIIELAAVYAKRKIEWIVNESPNTQFLRKYLKLCYCDGPGFAVGH